MYTHVRVRVCTCVLLHVADVRAVSYGAAVGFADNVVVAVAAIAVLKGAVELHAHQLHAVLALAKRSAADEAGDGRLSARVCEWQTGGCV